MNFKIEYDVPIPESATNIGPKTKRTYYPFKDMNVGGFFSVKINDHSSIDKAKKSIYFCVRNFQKKNKDHEFKIDIVGNDSIGVWRTK